MSNDKDFYSDEKLDYLIEKLDLQLQNIYHLIFTDNSEMIGELFPGNSSTSEDENFNDPEGYALDIEDKTTPHLIIKQASPLSEDDYLFLNPIKVIRDTWIDDNGNIEHKNYYTEWNPCIDGPFTKISKISIKSMNHTNKETMKGYLSAVYEEYYPVLSEIPDGDLTLVGGDFRSKIFLKENGDLIMEGDVEIKVKNNIVNFKDYIKKK